MDAGGQPAVQPTRSLMSAMESGRTSPTATASRGWTARRPQRQSSLDSHGGDHAPFDALPDRLRSRRREAPGDPALRVPWTWPGRLLNRLSIRALNEAWFRLSGNPRTACRAWPGSSTRSTGSVRGICSTDPAGFVQYQFAVPSDRGDVVQDAVEPHRIVGVAFISRRAEALRPGDPRSTLFRQEGWTLALDFPLGPPSLPALLDRLDEAVARPLVVSTWPKTPDYDLTSFPPCTPG